VSVECAKGDNACVHSKGRIDGQPDVAGPIAAHITRELAESNHIPDKRGRRSPLRLPKSIVSLSLNEAGRWVETKARLLFGVSDQHQCSAPLNLRVTVLHNMTI
jgi:hypothetical protein